MDALRQQARHSEFEADEVEEKVNDLLSRWHHWASQFALVAGFATCSSAMEQFRASRQYDSENGAIDQDIENRIMAAVDACIDRVHQPYRTALWINARNLSTGLIVWRSARLPVDALERALLVAEARARLVKVMDQRGLL
jgi:hypothetical protein